MRERFPAKLPVECRGVPVLKSYLIAVCRGSTLDRDNNCFTLFNLIEEIHVPEEGLGKAVPFELHVYWLVSEEGRNSEFEMRLVRVAEDGTDDPGTAIQFKTTDALRQRIRVNAIKLPKVYGSCELRAEWRAVGGDEWNRDEAVWPLQIQQAKGGAAPAEAPEPPGE